MFERILNNRSRFPRDGKMYVAIGRSGLTFSQSANARLKPYKKCVLLWDPDAKVFGICPVNGRMPGTFSLGFVGEDKGNRHVSGISWLKNEIVPKLNGREVFRLMAKKDIPEFEGELVYLADLSAEPKDSIGE